MVNTVSPVESVPQTQETPFVVDDQVRVRVGTVPCGGVIVGFQSDGIALVRVHNLDGLATIRVAVASLSPR